MQFLMGSNTCRAKCTPIHVQSTSFCLKIDRKEKKESLIILGFDISRKCDIVVAKVGSDRQVRM